VGAHYASATGSTAVPLLGTRHRVLLPSSDRVLALQLPFLEISESMGDHDSQIMDACGVD